MASFCAGVKVRRFGGAAGSMSSSVTSSFWARSIKGVELVKVMVCGTSCLALEGGTATAGVSRQPDRQGPHFAAPGGQHSCAEPVLPLLLIDTINAHGTLGVHIKMERGAWPIDLQPTGPR